MSTTLRDIGTMTRENIPPAHAIAISLFESHVDYTVGHGPPVIPVDTKLLFA